MFIVALAIAGCARADTPPTMDRAAEAKFNRDYVTARRLYAELTRMPSLDAKDREKAEIALANIEWRLDQNPAAARTRLDALGTRRAFQEKSRMEREFGQWTQAAAAARKTLELSTTADERRQAQTALAIAIIGGHVASRLDGTPAPQADLREGFTLARQLVDQERGRLATSLLLLQSALLLGEGPAALDAWHSYFGATVDSSILAPVAATLARLLPEWHGGASPDIAAALAASRLFDEAMLVGATGDIATYDAYIRRIKKLTDSYYRDVANKRADRRAYASELKNQTRALSDALHLKWDPKTLDSAVDSPLSMKFGSVIAAGETGKTYNLHFGHRVVDEKQNVTQYGKTAEVRYVLLENMVSNGFETWSWDGGSEHGGWGDVGLIVQVRRAYANGPLSAWRSIMEPSVRAESDEKIARESAADWKRAEANPAGYLPGLQARLERDSAQRILDELKARGLTGDELHDAFLVEQARRVNASSIFAHEGRHAIDAQYKKVGDAQAEFQAKLAELAFGPDPKLALADAMLDPNIGSSTPHGVANSRIMKGLVAWMSAHKTEIAGLDATKPLLPQLDKLTDDQLRAVARTMDPYAQPK